MDIKSIRVPPQGGEASKGVERSTPFSPLRRDAEAGKPAAEATTPTARAGQALASAVDDLNKFVQSTQRDLQFSIDQGSGRTVVKVVDPQTGDVIRQIPSELALSLAQALRDGDELRAGFIFSERV